MLAPDVRVVAMDLLRPPPGYQLDQAILTTYSLDLETLLALPLAVLAHADQGVDALLADPLLLVEGLREAGSRLHVFVDEDGMAVPRVPRELYALLEPCVHPVEAPNGGAFHPKVWIARFVDDHHDVLLRVAILSRNLTFDRSWDIALASEAVPAAKRKSRPSRDLANLVRALPDLATLELPRNVRATLEAFVGEIGRTRFPSSEGFSDPIVFHSLGLSPSGKAWTPRSDGSRLLAVAPFLSRTPLDQLSAVTSGERTLVARQDQLDDLPADALDRWSEVLVLADAAIDEEEDEGSARPSGLHAKLLAIEHGWDVTWWVGSANLSYAAWHGANVEMMAEVTGHKGRQNGQSGEGISRFFESGFRTLCQPYRRAEPTAESEAVVAARKALRAAREELLDADLRVVCVQSEDGWSWVLQGEVQLPEGVHAEVWPVSVPEASARPLELPLTWILPIARLTAFAAFRLRVPRSGVDAEQLTRKLPVEGMPEGRINHVLRGLISSPERLLRFLRALLGGLEGIVDWGAGDGEGAEGQWASGLGGDTLLEDFVRAASRDPKRLEPIRRILDDLCATDEGRNIIPEGLMDTWNAVEEAMARPGP